MEKICFSIRYTNYRKFDSLTRVLLYLDDSYPSCENYDADCLWWNSEKAWNASVQRTLVNGEDKEILTRRFLFIYFSYYGFIP